VEAEDKDLMVHIMEVELELEDIELLFQEELKQQLLFIQVQVFQ
jgi:hypothetical protein